MGTPLDRQTVLVIDDTEVIRSLLSETLTEKGYKVKCAPNAHTGIELATQLRPALIFCDTYMPDLDGFETVRRIKETLPDAVVVITNSMLTGESQCESEREFDYLLNKPFTLDELWSILGDVEKALGKKTSDAK